MSPLLRLKPYLRPYLGLLLGSALLAPLLALIKAAPAPLVKILFDEVLMVDDRSRLFEFGLAFIGIGVASLLIRFPHMYMLRIVVGRVNQKIKNDLYEHVMGLSADHFTKQSTGNLISRVGSDPQYIDGGLNALSVMLREPLHFLILFGYTLYLNWKLTLLIILIAPPLAIIFQASSKHLKRYIHKMAEENANLFSRLQESFTGVRVIKTFRLEKYVRKKFRERNEHFTLTYLKSAKLEEAAHPVVDLITYIAIAAVIVFGGAQVQKGQIQIGDFTAFFVAFGMMLDPIRRLNDVNVKLSQASAACKRIFEVFDWKPTWVEAENPKPIRGFEREIQFDHVSFNYPDAPERPVLKDVSFTLPRGRTLALVGQSGSGKSSLVSLIPRIFDVVSGSIRVDGVDVREASLDDLRKLIAVVSQDVFLFNDTIEENIRCGRLSATREEILEAARKAHALEFIETMPDGMKSVIGDRGQKLSGGERQRISIARAFLREAPILLLDEATSSLDTRSERIVQVAIDELMKDRTTLIIAHRLSTIRTADQILVLKDGEIVESGSHDELMGRGGEYSRFHQTPV